jgi:hypothetical protein
MVTAALVNSDTDIGRRIVAALTRAAIPATVYLWAFIPQLQEWQFIIATPLVDAKGPLAAYGEVNKALQKDKAFDDVPPRRIFLKSPGDRVLRSLEKQSRAVSQEAFPIVNEQIAGSFVEEAYLYAGSIHIVQLGDAKGNSPNKYSVIYTPYSGPGGAAPSLKFESPESVVEFLVDKLRIYPSDADVAMKEVSTKGSASIPNVQLRTQDLKRLRLA